MLCLVQCTPANLQKRKLTATIFVGEWCISEYARSHIWGDRVSVVGGSSDSMACRSALWRAWYCWLLLYSRRPPKKLTALDEFVMLEAVINRPAIHLCEIQHLVEQITGTTISESAICCFLHKNNFSRKKLQCVARQRSEVLRAQFTSDCSLYSPQMLVFIDKTGSDRRHAMCEFGYSLVGLLACILISSPTHHLIMALL